MPQWHHTLPWDYAKDILDISEGSLPLCGSLLPLSWSQELEAYSMVREMEKTETLLDQGGLVQLEKTKQELKQKLL